MKKKLGIALVLALVATMTLGGTALAWDFSDPEIYPDAIMTDHQTRGYTLEDMLDNGQGDVAERIYPESDDNIYVDEFSHSGDLAHVSIGLPRYYIPNRVRVYTTDEIMNNDPVGGWKISYNGDMFYFAKEPRGYNVGVGDFYGAYAGQFLVDMVCATNYQAYNWVEGWRGKTLAEPVFQSVTFYNNGSKTIYILEIPEGTVIEGYYGGRVQHLVFKVRDGEFLFSPNLKLSNPATLYEARVSDGVAEAMREVLTFTEVLNGNAS